MLGRRPQDAGKDNRQEACKFPHQGDVLNRESNTFSIWMLCHDDREELTFSPTMGCICLLWGLKLLRRTEIMNGTAKN